MRRHVIGVLMATVATQTVGVAFGEATQTGKVQTHSTKTAVYVSHVLAKTPPTITPRKSRAMTLSKAAAVEPSAAFYSGEGEQIIATGTRDLHRKARDSISPVVVISAAQLRQTGQADLRDALALLVPSLTHQTVSPGNTTDSINLRGLTSNQVLVLVNGKRRHTASAVFYSAGLQQGTTPVDIDMLPVSEIDHIEVLEDGAAAQYGSDAIAGVINIILSHRNHGIELHADNGGYYAGDGFTSRESINWATALPNDGFFNIGAELKFQDHTVRGGWDNRTNKNDSQFLGNPRKLQEVIGYNMEFNINDSVKLYSNATYGHKNTETQQAYRVPRTFSSAGYPNLYPQGFIPNITNNENDYGVTVGFKGDTFLGFQYDVSTTYGGNHNDVDIYNTGSQSMLQYYGYTPTRFHQTSYTSTQWTNNADFHRAFDVPLLAGPLNLAFGAEYRYDSYKIGSGEYASYFISGPQGNHGIPPALATTSNRNVTAGYVNVSTKLLPKWQIDIAGRFEHYTDAGNTETGKFSTRYDFNKYVALRGTISNGFRAPTLAEEHFSSLSQTPSSASGILAVSSAGAKILGATPLKPERSTSFSLGILLNPIKNMHLSLDGYLIDIRDRIVTGGGYGGARAFAALAASGLELPSSATTATASYLTNGASTRTVGIDITATYLTRLQDYGRINWDLAANFNQTKFLNIGRDANGNVAMNSQQQAYLTSYTPRNKLSFGGHWFYKNMDFAIHEIRYGHTTANMTYWNDVPASMVNSVTEFLRVMQQPKFQTDIAFGYNITPRFHATLGANNVFNAYPTKVPYKVNQYGSYIYNTDVQQMGINGGYYYLQLDYKL